MKYPFSKVIGVYGMPRSGTTWVSQILDSSYYSKFKMDPNFSYPYKNEINEFSVEKDIINFFTKIYYNEKDEFLNQIHNKNIGIHPNFEKVGKDFLLYKTTRHFHILPNLLRRLEKLDFKVVAIVRNPCGVIYSWINSYKEFEKKGCHKSDWRKGLCRKTDPGEFWGFQDWIFTTKLFVLLERKYSNFKVFKYEDFVYNRYQTVQDMFEFCGIEANEQTYEFLQESCTINDSDPYSVYKRPEVAQKWREKLDETIKDRIFFDVQKEKLSEFFK